MTVLVLGIVATSLMSVLCWLLWRAWNDDAERLIEDFMERFPGKCPICAYHRYGILHGFVSPDEPRPQHNGCPEGNV